MSRRSLYREAWLERSRRRYERAFKYCCEGPSRYDYKRRFILQVLAKLMRIDYALYRL